MGHIGRLVVACLVVVSMSSSAFSAKTMKRAMGDVSVSLGKYFKSIQAERVRVERPRGPVDDAATARMQVALVQALEQQGVTIGKARPDCVVEMDYSRSSGSSQYSMTIRIRDREGQTIGSFAENFKTQEVTLVKDSDSEKIDIDVNPIERTIIEGRSVDTTLTSSGGTTPATRASLEKSLNGDPSVNIETSPTSSTKSVVSAAKGSLFQIEILAKPGDMPGDYQPRVVEDDGGYAFCKLNEGEVYAVRVTNNATHAVAVDLTIDGINIWHKSSNPAWKKNGKFVVDAGRSTVMHGWHFGENGDASDYREFEVVQLPDSLVASLGSDQDPVGQVSALFYAAWKPGETQPAVETITKKGPATGVGKPIKNKTENVKRFVGDSLLAGVTIRYTRPDHASDLPVD